MKINDDHLYHGAALTQIAEHPQFTAINAVRVGGGISQSAFRINDSIGVYLKYASEPKPPAEDYIFTFTKANKDELAKIATQSDKLFVALVCIDDRQICCLEYSELQAWFQKRQHALGKNEDRSTILVKLPKGKEFRVNMNQPRRRKVYLADPQLVPRNRFPNALFE
jgi:hypothetical protein